MLPSYTVYKIPSRLVWNSINIFEDKCNIARLISFHAKLLSFILFDLPLYFSSGNIASVLAFDDYLNRDFKIFKDMPESEDNQRRNLVPYFL